MTLDELRNQVKVNIFDFVGSVFSPAELTAYVNSAMHYVSALAAGANSHLFVQEYFFQPTNAGAEPFVLVPTDPPVRQIIRAWRMDDNIDGAQKSLEIIQFRDIEHEQIGSALARPKVFLFNEQIGFVRPPTTGFEAKVWGVRSIPDLVAGVDEPIGLPDRYQGLIPTYAAIMALAAENVDAGQWAQLFQSQATALGLDVNLRNMDQERTR